MKCPLCNVDLVMADRQGIEIDYCPKCRGIWLDRGEIDKIIERSQGFEQRAAEAARAAAPSQPAPQPIPQPISQRAAYAPPVQAPQGWAPQGWGGPPAPGWAPPQQPYAPRPHWKRDDDDDDDRRKYGHQKKRKGFLSEILDFD